MHREGGRRESFVSERETVEVRSWRVREVAVHIQTTFAWGHRELERKLPAIVQFALQAQNIETFQDNFCKDLGAAKFVN